LHLIVASSLSDQFIFIHRFEDILEINRLCMAAHVRGWLMAATFQRSGE
jgi:hypothetical protein